MNKIRRSTPRIVGILVVGMALITVGISTDNTGLLAAGFAFVGLAIVSRLWEAIASDTRPEEPTADSGPQDPDWRPPP
jgi:hypothetical protein